MVTEYHVRHIIFLLPLTLHVIGLYLLYQCKKSPLWSCNQFLHIVTLNGIEVVWSFSVVIRTFIEGSTANVFLKLYVVLPCFMWLVFVMILISVDRFLEVYLNIKYKLIWSTNKTKLVLVLSLVISFVLTFCMVAVNYNDVAEKQLAFAVLYLIPIFNILFFVVTLLFYGYIVTKLNEKRHIFRRNTLRKRIIPERFRQQMTIPTLLILSFLVFNTVPDTVYYVHIEIRRKYLPEALNGILTFFHLMCFTLDFFIYTLSSKHIRKELRKITERIIHFMVCRKKTDSAPKSRKNIGCMVA